MKFQEEYLFNPFMLENVGDEELSRQIDIIASRFKRGETPYDVAFNIQLESDLLMIYGEFIARFQESYSLTKLEADNMVAKLTYNLRKDWNNVSKEKAPAMSFFEAQAEDNAKSLREKQYRLDSQLTRFKKAYSSLETKQNALKKKLEAMRYETI
jgi:hypothetical protein